MIRIFDGRFFGFFFYGFGLFREADRLHFVYLVYLERGDTLALGLVALHADELFHIDVEGFAEHIVASEGHPNARIHHIGEQDELALLVLAQEAQLAGRSLEGESLEVRIALLVGIVEGSTPHLVRVELLDDADARLVVVVQVEVRCIEFAVFHDNEDEVVAMELAQVLATLVVVQTEHIRVEPYLSSA